MGSDDCLFCRIVRGEIPADIVAEGDSWLAFRDIQPQAPVHVLVIPRRHVEGVGSLGEEDRDLAGELLFAAAQVARSEGIAETGYRAVTNVGERAGQSVFHLHVHVLGGRRMRWPPG
ncbi:MAG: histidine triad nucleotide-binding protein [Candidatus Palauibacterales bacterium]|jgi:histidine triad (HIT) family protein|nr:histidine triad nucleotide-binding protein [Candidatus Palauibacterales bacterium]MDP2483084.1 histidine triad nucleotide-binding protein [Candidatus Palauibacterales bacterium]